MSLDGTPFVTSSLVIRSHFNLTKSSKLNATIDDTELDTVELHAYPDADLAGTYDSIKATSGGFIHLSGLNNISLLVFDLRPNSGR